MSVITQEVTGGGLVLRGYSDDGALLRLPAAACTGPGRLAGTSRGHHREDAVRARPLVRLRAGVFWTLRSNKQQLHPNSSTLPTSASPPNKPGFHDNSSAKRRALGSIDCQARCEARCDSGIQQYVGRRRSKPASALPESFQPV